MDILTDGVALESHVGKPLFPKTAVDHKGVSHLETLKQRGAEMVHCSEVNPRQLEHPEIKNHLVLLWLAHVSEPILWKIPCHPEIAWNDHEQPWFQKVLTSGQFETAQTWYRVRSRWQVEQAVEPAPCHSCDSSRQIVVNTNRNNNHNHNVFQS